MSSGSSDELDQLRKAVDGLLYSSESDEPFEVFRWPAMTHDPASAVAAHAPKGATIKEQSLDAFFADLMGSDEAARFDQLRLVLESLLKSARVYRAGSIEVDVFILGTLRSGEWAGLHTRSIET
jgi:hypothetical protein